MKIKSIGKNQTELYFEITDEHFDYYGSITAIYIIPVIVFFSYETPVAVNFDGKFYKTSKKHSVTTSKHIIQWLDGVQAEIKDQSFFDNLIA